MRLAVAHSRWRPRPARRGGPWALRSVPDENTRTLLIHRATIDESWASGGTQRSKPCWCLPSSTTDIRL